MLPLWDLFIHSVNIYEASTPGQDLDWVLGTMGGGLGTIPVLPELTVYGESQTVKRATTVHHDEWDDSGS